MALLLGRMMDKDINRGYKKKQQDSSPSLLTKALKKLDPVSIKPAKSVRKMVKITLKK
ncbi:MAG: hypothetical protein IKW58_01630 [Alphaproteobacteria bacterium]|nr:hypothetical protein [Alphaproteobacteria bacterium]